MPDDDIRESVRDLLRGKLLGLGSDDEKAWELRHMLDAILDYYLGDENEEDQVVEVERKKKRKRTKATIEMLACGRSCCALPGNTPPSLP